jgi:DNA-directed RNA polymerase III subunit RPC4
MGGGGGISGVQRGGRAGGGGTGGGSGGAGRASASGSRVKSEGITTLNGGNKDAGGESQPEKFIPEPEYPDGDDTPRVDIEQINLLSSDEDEPIVTGSRSRGRVAVDSNKGGQKPIRLQRYEHKNRVAQLNTDPTINLDAENIKDDPDVVVVDEARSTAIVSGATRIKEAQVKDEPGTTASDVLPLSPMLKFKPPLTDIDDDDANMENYEDIENGEVTRVEALPASTLEAKLSRHSKKEKKPVIQTAEDRAEYERHIEDMRVLKDELGNMHTSQQALDGEGNVEIEDAVGDGNKEGRLYLFQFPPVLPKLYNPMTQLKPLHPGQIPIKIKEEPDGDVEMSSSGNKNTIDLTKGKPVNQNGGETILVEEDGKKKDIKRGREKYVDEEGYTGKLIVRESGRVELDWGGTRMLVGRGIPTGFLTTGVLLDPMDPGKDKSEVLGGAFGGRTFQPAVEGKAVGMGEIMGKFVVTPDFGNIM